MAQNEMRKRLILIHDELINGYRVLHDDIPAAGWCEPASLLLFHRESVSPVVLCIDDEAKRIHVPGKIIIAERMLGHAVVYMQSAGRLFNIIPDPDKKTVSVLHFQIALKHMKTP